MAWNGWVILCSGLFVAVLYTLAVRILVARFPDGRNDECGSM